MDVFIFRGLPGSPAYRAARLLLHRPTDYIIDLSAFYETQQGNLFVTESPPEEAEDHLRRAARSQDVSRVGICGMMDKGWIMSILEEEDLEQSDIYWMVVEGAKRPPDAPPQLYDRLERTFDLDLSIDA